jgi:hypothetical protein
MNSENQIAGIEQVSQQTIEAVLKLAQTGSSPEAISFFFGLDAQMIHHFIANDPLHRARMVQSIKERSRKYRCAQSNRLMISPVIAPDDNFYEQCIFEAHPSLSSERALPNPRLKEEIAEFSKESLKVLEGYLRQKDPQEDILELTAECLSVLSPDDTRENALKTLGAVGGNTVRELIRKLRGLVPDEMLLSLMNQRELPSHALTLAALIILEPRSERAFEEAFRCFTELLSHVNLGAEAIDLAEEVSEGLSSTQLSQMNAALGASPREGGDRLDGLRLREAYALLREGKVEAADCLVNTLRISPCLEKEVLRFYDEAGLSSGKVAILEQKLSAKLEEISQESQSLAETLSIFHQLLKAELSSHKSEAPDQSLISLKPELRCLYEQAAEPGEEAKQLQSFIEQSQNTEAATQQVLSSLRGDIMALDQRLEEQSKKTEANEQALNSLRGELAETKHLLKDTMDALYHLQAQLHEDTLPNFIYSYTYNSDQLHRTDLVTGEQSSHRVPSYRFKLGCYWSEVPGGSLFITGGGVPAVREVVRIDARTFEVSSLTPMHTPRSAHSAVYHTRHLYVIGGLDRGRWLRECERYIFVENRWEALPPLPRACWGSNGVVVERSLYALGGRADQRNLDLVQKLSLESLTWEVMQFRLPYEDSGISCFKLRDTEVYLVVNRTLCSFTASYVRPIKTLTEDIHSWRGASYYRRGTLYWSYDEGTVRSHEIGSLSS